MGTAPNRKHKAPVEGQGGKYWLVDGVAGQWQCRASKRSAWAVLVLKIVVLAGLVLGCNEVGQLVSLWTRKRSECRWRT